MKKLISMLVVVFMMITLVSCGNATLVNEAVNASKTEKIEGMTYETASGEYKLSDMTKIGKENIISAESYAENTLILADNGTATLNVRLNKEDAETVSLTAKYKISDNGVILFEDGFCIVSTAEQKICNGKTIVISGNLGAQLAVNMVYKKNVA